MPQTHPNTFKECQNYKTKCKTPIFYTETVAGVSQSVEFTGLFLLTHANTSLTH